MTIDAGLMPCAQLLVVDGVPAPVQLPRNAAAGEAKATNCSLLAQNACLYPPQRLLSYALCS